MAKTPPEGCQRGSASPVARARKAGATIIAEPTDQPYGDRSYRAVDIEGHRWIFSTHVRDVDFGGETADA